MRLLVVSGLPGTGKSALAAVLARRLGAAHCSIDPVEEALLACGVPRSLTGVAAYEAVRAAAETSLAAGRDVVVDAVNDVRPARETWTRAAAATGAELHLVVLHLPDRAEHRRRLEGRSRDLPRVGEPTWAEVEQRAVAPWPATARRLAATVPPERLADAVLAGLAADQDPPGPAA